MGAFTGAGLTMVAMWLMAVAAVSSTAVGATGLSTSFYDKSCPKIYSIVKAEVQKAVKVEKRMAASLVRLHFHDCFVNGCDGSLLLDNTTAFTSEKYAIGNLNSVRGFKVVDAIKAALEKACPRTVSCADILAIAYRDSAVEVGLVPQYPVYFGRRDSLTADIAEATKRLPSAGSSYAELKNNFSRLGLDETDLVALSGAHTIGRVKCLLVKLFLNDINLNTDFRDKLKLACPINTTVHDLDLQNFDYKTPNKFDNNYYKNLRKGQGIIRSDQVLQSTKGPNVAIVKDFAENQENFFKQFGLSSIKMGNIKPLTGKKGQIRVNCRLVNRKAETSEPEPLVAIE